MKHTAIVLAAGRGKRLNSSVPKQYLMLNGYPVLYYSLRAFEKSPDVDDIVLVAGADDCEYCREQIVERYGLACVSAIVPGGRERFDSVYQGLLACPDADVVLIHDGARPFLTGDLIKRGMACASRFGACAAGVPAKDTVKLADGDGKIVSTPDRGSVWIAQTPQIFSYPLLKKVYERMFAKGAGQVTDDAMVVERFGGCGVHLYEGDYRNIKITTPEDMTVAGLYAKMDAFAIR